jgi:YggT family protein
MNFLVSAIALIVQLYSFVLLARVLLSFAAIDPYHPVAQFLYRLTEPVLEPIRRILPRTGMLDLSPMVALILINVIARVLINLLR